MRSAFVAALLFLVAACTNAPPPGEEPPAPSPQRARTSTTEPLVLVVHASSSAPRLALVTARRVLAGKVRTWRPIDGTDRPLRVADAASAVTRDRDAIAAVPASAVSANVRAAVVAGIDPLRRPAAYPLRTQGPTPPRPTTVTVVGDIMLGRRVGSATAVTGDPAAPLRALRSWLPGSALTLGNLESTVSTAGPPQQGGDSFAASPSVVDGLADAGFDAVSLANNHTGDFGTRALLDTVATFREAPVHSFGAGRNLRAAGRAYIATRNGVRFGVLGFNAIGETPRATPRSPGALSVRMPPRTGPLSAADLAHVTRLVRRLDHRVDVVLVVPHWGMQYTHEAGPSQRLVARRLVDAGADLVVGGHPHWVQGLEWYGGAVVAHSLGNLVFDMDFMTETQQGVALEATYWGGDLKAVTLVPYMIGSDFAPRPATGAVAADILGDVWSHSTGPFALPPR